MWQDLLASVVNKRTAPYFIWTSVFLVCAIYFWLSSRSPQKPDGSDSRGRGAGGSSGKSSRKQVSVHLDGTLLRLGSGTGGAAASSSSSSSDGACGGSGSVEVEDAAVAPFLELCSKCEVFTFAIAADDERENAVRAALERIGAFEIGLRSHRVMFSSSEAGRASMVRQLQPAVHFEASAAAAESLSGKVPELRLIGSAEWPTFCDGSCLKRLC